MLLSINYSPAAAELLTAGHIRLDYFKAPDWHDLVAEARLLRPVAVHFSLQAGSGRLHQTDWGLVDRLLAETGTPFVNLHLESNAADYPGVPADTTELSEVRRIIDALHQDVWTVVQRYGAQRVIAENAPYKAQWGTFLRPAVEPQVISQLLDETGCGLLLDLSHARISAHYLGMDEQEYIGQLPVRRIKEMHFAGIHLLDGQLCDHLSILETDWLALEWALERIRLGDWAPPWMLAFEYGGVGDHFAWRTDPSVIAGQTPRLYEMVHR